MTVAQAPEQLTPGLVRPPVKKAAPDQLPIPGQIPAVGAGSAAPLPAPQSDGISPMLPFGNGVNPVNLAPPPTGYDFAGGISPVNTVLNPPGGINVTPQLPAPASYPAADNTDLGNTLISRDPNAPKISDATAQLAARFGSTPQDIAAGPNVGGANIAAGPNVGGANVGYEAINDPRSSRYNDLLDKSVGDLGTTDRRSMLQSLLQDFDTQSAERDNNAVTSLGRSDAALGRLGSGMTSQAIAQIGRQSARDKGIFRNQLAADTIDKEIADRFQKTGLLSNLSNDIYGRASADRGFKYGVDTGNRDFQYNADQANRGFNYDVASGNRAFQYGADTANRGFNYGVARDNQAARTAAQQTGFNQANTLANQDYGQGIDARNELRGERTYQDQTVQNDINNQTDQAKLQDYLTNSGFNRATTRYQTGNTGNPAATYSAAAGDLGGQSDATLSALMQYLQSLGIGAGSQ